MSTHLEMHVRVHYQLNAELRRSFGEHPRDFHFAGDARVDPNASAHVFFSESKS